MHDQYETVVTSALKLAETLGWDMVTMQDIASESRVGLSDMRMIFCNKTDILRGIGRMTDTRVLTDFRRAPADSDKDALFDIMMDRFDSLNQYRAGILSILDTMKTDPKQALITAPHVCQSMTWMLEACGIQTNGMRGMAKVAGTSAIYLKAAHTWTTDDTPDLAKVMACLDKNLTRAERFGERLGF